MTDYSFIVDPDEAAALAEFDARDIWDDIEDLGECNGCPVCGHREDCIDCKQAAADYQEYLESLDDDDSEV